MRREAKKTVLVNKYLRISEMFGAFEIKQTQRESIPFACLEAHQRTALLAAEQKGLVWKISDADPRTKPFDVIKLPPCPGYVIIVFPGCLTFIRIKAFLKAENTSKIKSLFLEDAKKIAEKIVHV